MPQSLSAVYAHLIFSTKDRRPWLRERATRERLHAQLGAISKELDCAPLQIGGVEDHAHLLCRIGRSITQADWVKELKRVSNLWQRGQGPEYGDFQWQRGYSIFSVSHSNIDRVRDYIAGQEKHHQKLGYQEELRAFFKRHAMGWDEQYVWD